MTISARSARWLAVGAPTLRLAAQASAPRARAIGAAGLVVVPGFIDMRNHSDDSLF